MEKAVVRLFTQVASYCAVVMHAVVIAAPPGHGISSDGVAFTWKMSCCDLELHSLCTSIRNVCIHVFVYLCDIALFIYYTCVYIHIHV